MRNAAGATCVVRCDVVDVVQVSPYLVASGSGCYATPYYNATAAAGHSPVVIPSSAPALTETAPTALPASVHPPCPQPEVAYLR